jgi:hypothetical protein
LQQSVRADSRAVYDLDFRKLDTGFSADTREALLNCERRIGRGGRKLEKFNAPVSFENEIGERSARVDADAYEDLLILINYLLLPSSRFHSKREWHPARAALDNRLQTSPHL